MPTLMDTHIENRERVQPNHTNSHNTAHGGIVMKWMDEIGAMSAMRIAGNTCVTASMDEVDFKLPIFVGQTALIKSYVYETGKTSLKVRIQAFREDPMTGEKEQTTESYFIYVAVDNNHDPTPVPELKINNEKSRKLRQKALKREEEITKN